MTLWRARTALPRMPCKHPSWLVTNLLTFSAIWFSMLLNSVLMSWAFSHSLQFSKRAEILVVAPRKILPNLLNTWLEGWSLLMRWVWWQTSNSWNMSIDSMTQAWPSISISCLGYFSRLVIAWRRTRVWRHSETNFIFEASASPTSVPTLPSSSLSTRSPLSFPKVPVSSSSAVVALGTFLFLGLVTWSCFIWKGKS